MILDEHYTLSNGANIPKLGLGTWFIEDGDAARAVWGIAMLIPPKLMATKPV